MKRLFKNGLEFGILWDSFQQKLCSHCGFLEELIFLVEIPGRCFPAVPPAILFPILRILERLGSPGRSADAENIHIKTVDQ